MLPLTKRFCRKLFLNFTACLGFYTIFPISKSISLKDENYEASHSFLPFIGIFIFFVIYISDFIIFRNLPDEIFAVFILIVPTIITRGLHDDGLADFMDGMFGGYTIEKRLAIMKDSHIGVFGVLTLIFFYLLSYATLISIINSDNLLSAIFSALVFPRIFCFTIPAFLPYIRKKNGILKKATLKTDRRFAIISIFIFAISFFYLPFITFVLYIGIISTFTFLFISFLKRNLQGYTGDCIGAYLKFMELITYFYLTSTYYNFKGE